MNQAKIFITVTFLLAFAVCVSAQQSTSTPSISSEIVWRGYDIRIIALIVQLTFVFFTILMALLNYLLLRRSIKNSKETLNVSYNSKQIDIIRMFNDRFTEIIEKPIVDKKKPAAREIIFQGNFILSEDVVNAIPQESKNFLPTNFELTLKNNTDTTNKWSEEIFWERFWGLQYEQFFWWSKGLINDEFFEIWMIVRRWNYEDGFNTAYKKFTSEEYRKSYENQKKVYGARFTESKKFFTFLDGLHKIELTEQIEMRKKDGEPDSADVEKTVFLLEESKIIEFLKTKQKEKSKSLLKID